MEQPLLPPNAFIVENQETASVVLHDPVTGARRTIPVKHDAVILNPQTGERAFNSTMALQSSLDGRVIKPEEHLFCRECGRGPWAAATVAYCVDCQRVIGRHCCVKNQAQPLCKHCRHRRAWKALWSWLTGIGSTA